MRKICSVLLLISMLLGLSACGLLSQGGVTAAESTDVPRIMSTPEPTLTNDPAELYEGVETDQRVVSLIFEGYSDEASMQALVSLLAERGVDCVFFLSGVTASEHPDILRSVSAAGIEIGNYGITGRKNMQEDSAADNIHQFTRGQELIAEACGEVPTLFRCNGTEYTRPVLQAAAASGLSAGVEPTVYLNHRSFSDSGSASEYMQRLTRGSIISVKLGQELTAAEYGEVINIDEQRPAIDPTPSISEAAEDIARSTYQTLAAGVEWLLDALEAEGYIIVSPQLLQDAAVDMFGQPAALDGDTLSRLDIGSYPLPVTLKPLSSVDTRAGSDADFKDTLFVGDSMMADIEGYVQWRRQAETAPAQAEGVWSTEQSGYGEDGETAPQYLGGAVFAVSNELTVEAALMRVSESSRHPELAGSKMTVEDMARSISAKRVYIMLPCGDPRVYTGAQKLTNVKLLIYSVMKNSPGTQVCVVSYPPSRADFGGKLTSEKIFRYDLELCRLCMEYGIPFIDAASVLRDDTGSLAEEYCLNPGTGAAHLNDAGCERWLNYLIDHIPVQVQPEKENNSNDA